MNQLHIKFLIVLCATSQPVCLAEDASTEQKPGSKFAARVEGLLSSMKETEYQHTTAIDEKNGSVKCDCSGLVGFMLRQECPEAYLSVRGQESPWRKRPLAVTYYETFVAAGQDGGQSGPWQQVKSLMDAVPGDVLAWRKKTVVRGSTTGHTCMIAGRPQMQADGTVRVRLIDSTRSIHADDTRPDGTTGLGAGFKSFLVNEDGEPTGYFVGKRRVKVAIAVGRIVSPNSKAATPPAAKSKDRTFVGMNIVAAHKLAEKQKLDVRVIREQGKPVPVKWQIRDDRLNFVVENDNVVEAIRG